MLTKSFFGDCVILLALSLAASSAGILIGVVGSVVYQLYTGGGA